MREVKFTVYQLKELTKEVQEKAIEMYRENNYDRLFDSWDSDDMKINMENILETEGYPDMEVSFSLSNSQGDGVRFVGELYEDTVYALGRRLMAKEDFEKLMKLKDLGMGLWGNISPNSHRYFHYNTMDLALDSDLFNTDLEEEGISQEENDLLEGLISDLEELIGQDIKEQSKELERGGYKEIEYHYSDEYIKEMLIANDNEFTEDGELWS